MRSFNNVSRLIRAVKNIIEKLEEQIDGISLKNQPLKNSPKAVCVELKNSPQDFDCEFDCESGNCSENLTIYKGFAEQFIRDLNWLQPNSFNKKKLPKGLNLLKFSTFKWLCYASKAISDIKKILKIKPAGDPYFLTTMSSIIIKNLNLTFEQIEKDEFKVNEDVKLSIKRRLAYASKSLEKYLSKLHKNCHSLPRYFLYRLTNIGSLG